MTEQITRPTERDDDFLSELPIAPTRIQSEIDRLTFAMEAMRLAISAVDKDSHRAWGSGTSVLLEAVFDRLAFEVANAISTLQLMLPPPRD
jgi:hypothetical protein